MGLPDEAQPLLLSLAGGVGAVPAADWDALVDDDDPFLEHAFLAALERSGSVGEGTGWEPRFLFVHRGERLVGAVPLYLKTDSMGEFIWDFAWAEGARLAGIPYFPKLVAAIPFTPATSHRLLVHPAERRSAVVPLLRQGLLQAADQLEASSVHVLFCRPEEVDELSPAGFLSRSSYQFHWSNRRPIPYRDFDDFLSGYHARHRKQVRHERKVAASYGLRFVVAWGADLDERAWQALDSFYRTTVYAYGSIDSLTPEFFRRLRQTHAQRLLAALAYRGDEPVAATINFVRGDRLCGRYWGADARLPLLHFELCFYRLIDHAIAHGLQRFEGGAGGEQKLKRGLLPEPTFSAHFIRHPGLARAIAGYVKREARAIDVDMRMHLASSPFK
jgi:hypothetical protein